MFLWALFSGGALAACGSGGTASDAGSTGDAPDQETSVEAGALTCAAYCAAIQAACTGSLLQYSDRDDCLKSCAAFPVGQRDDNLVDTLGCRISHAAMAAEDASSAAIHCVHAGPGGDVICGDNCSGYCDIAMMYCTAANSAKLYDTRAQCLTDCATRGETVPYTAGNPGRTDLGNEVGCLLYHAQMASTAPDGHCLGDLAIVGGACHAP
jgi:hypothetical protein